MDIRLGTIFCGGHQKEASQIELKDTLTVEQFKKFKESISEINKLQRLRDLLSILLLNENEFLTSMETVSFKLATKGTHWRGIKEIDMEEVSIAANRLFLNYLSSVRAFIDHCKTNINRYFGANSENFSEFKKMLSFFYDDIFAYRFLYKLRNYSQHCGIPINSITFNQQFNAENNTVDGTLEVMFDRNQLLSNYDGWGEKIKVELQQKTETFDVASLMIKNTLCVKEVEHNIELFHKDSLLEAINYITNISGHLRQENYEVIVAYDFRTDENGNLSKFQNLPVPFEKIDLIKNILFQDNQ